MPGTYLNGFFESVPLPYAEAGYGYPEEGQSMIDVTNGKVIRLLVDDEPFDIRYGTLQRHERVLDLRDGVLRREVEWTSPAGQAVRVRSTRLVSFVQRADRRDPATRSSRSATPARIVVQSALVANEPVPEQTPTTLARPPRCARRSLPSTTRTTIWRPRSGTGRARAACGWRPRWTTSSTGRTGTVTEVESEPDLARVTVSTELAPGQTLRVVKLVAYGWSGQRTDAGGARSGRRRAGGREADRLGRAAARASARTSTTSGIAPTSRSRATPRCSRRCGSRSSRCVQAGARAEQRAIPAKGLTGRGYDGHTFWDMETYTLPVLTYTAPDAARDALLLAPLDPRPGARTRARQLGLGGAAFPWRTIRGEECSGYWPAGTAGLHINADIADAVRRYVDATGDDDFERGPGSSCWSRPPACGARSVTTTPKGAFASTG